VSDRASWLASGVAAETPGVASNLNTSRRALAQDDEHESRRVADVERGSRSLVVRSESLGRAAQTLGSSRIASEQH
jgi:hypothetical protein